MERKCINVFNRTTRTRRTFRSYVGRRPAVRPRIVRCVHTKQTKKEKQTLAIRIVHRSDLCCSTRSVRSFANGTSPGTRVFRGTLECEKPREKNGRRAGATRKTSGGDRRINVHTHTRSVHLMAQYNATYDLFDNNNKCIVDVNGVKIIYRSTSSRDVRGRRRGGDCSRCNIT